MLKNGISMIKFSQVLKKILKEDVSYTPEKANQILVKHKKDFDTYQTQAERMYNIMENFSVGDLLEPNGENKISKFSDTANALADKISNIGDELINIADNEDNLYDEAHDLASKYNKLYSHLWQMYNFTYKLVSIKNSLKDREIEELIKYKKQ